MIKELYVLVMIIQSTLPSGVVEKIYLDLDPIPYESWSDCNNEVSTNLDKYDPTHKLRDNKNNSVACVSRQVNIVNPSIQKIHPAVR